MLRTSGIAALLALALVMPAQEAAAQDPLLGGLLGGAAGAIIGGAAGGGRGAAIGAIIGGTTGAVIAAEGQRRGAYYYWRNGCYVQRPDGAYVAVAPGYCAPAAYYPPPPPPPAAYYAHSGLTRARSSRRRPRSPPARMTLRVICPPIAQRTRRRETRACCGSRQHALCRCPCLIS
jgi:hypothetical protein